MNAIELRSVTFGYDGHPLFIDLGLVVNRGDFLGIIGPNGAGKSTLLRLSAGLLTPQQGSVVVMGHDARRTPRRKLARLVAVVPQESQFAFDYPVSEVVMMGRFCRLGPLQPPRLDDVRAVRRAMDFTDITRLANSGINRISSGEKQRVLLARALAQEPDILLLDEVTSYLDLAYQHSVAEMLVKLNGSGTTIVLLSHDLNQMALCCSRLLLLKQGRVLASASPDQVLTRELINEAYGIEALFIDHPQSGRPQVLLPDVGAIPRGPWGRGRHL